MIGAGALGIVTAVKLAQAGHAVSVVASSESKRERYVANGFTIDGYRMEPVRRSLDVVAAPEEVREPFDLMITATKCAAAAGVTKRWLPVLSPAGTFVPYVNGLMGDEMSAIVGERMIECAVYYGATLVEPGYSRLTGKGSIHVGPWPRGAAGAGTRAHRAAELLAAVVPTTAHDDMFSVKWNKLVANSAITSVGVLSGMLMSDMVRQAPVVDALLSIAKESMSIAVAAGAKPMSLGGNNVDLLAKLPRMLAGLALRLATRENTAYKSSSQQSLDRGEATEVDYLNGRVAREARERERASPWNDETVRAVHEVETDPAGAGLEKVRELVRRARSAA